MLRILKHILFASVIFFSCSSPADRPGNNSADKSEALVIPDKICIIFKGFNSPDRAFGWFYFDKYGQQKKIFSTKDSIVLDWKQDYDLAYYTIPQTSFYPVSPGDTLIITKTNEYPYYPRLQLLNKRLSEFELNFPAFLSQKNGNTFEYSLRKIPDKSFPLIGNATDYYTRAINILDSCAKTQLISKEYEKWIRESIRYSYYANILDDGNNQDLTLPANIFSEPAIGNPLYRLFLKKHFLVEDLKKKPDYAKGYVIAKEKYSGEAREFLLLTCLLHIVDKFPDDRNKYIAMFNNDSRNDDYKNFIEKNISSIVKKEKLNYDIVLSTDREELSFDSLISSLKGNIIYLDVWASWCKPCREEMPMSKKLKDSYAGKNVKFIFLSIDENFGNWLEGVKDENLGADSYLLANPRKSLFYKKYNIEAIPRYIILNKKGKIIDADAPRPSDYKLKKLIDLNI